MNLRFLNLGYFPLSKGKIIQSYKCSHVKRIWLDLETASPKYRGLNLKKPFFHSLKDSNECFIQDISLRHKYLNETL